MSGGGYGAVGVAGDPISSTLGLSSVSCSLSCSRSCSTSAACPSSYRWSGDETWGRRAGRPPWWKIGCPPGGLKTSPGSSAERFTVLEGLVLRARGRVLVGISTITTGGGLITVGGGAALSDSYVSQSSKFTEDGRMGRGSRIGLRLICSHFFSRILPP